MLLTFLDTVPGDQGHENARRAFRVAELQTGLEYYRIWGPRIAFSVERFDAAGWSIADETKDRPLCTFRALQIASGVLAAVEHAHRQGSVHFFGAEVEIQSEKCGYLVELEKYSKMDQNGY